MKLKHITPHPKINSKWLRLKYNPWHHKTPRSEHKKNILRHRLYKHFLRLVFQSNGNKNKNKQTGLKQIYKFCTTKKTINKMKRQPMDWEKIFANDMAEKGLISKIYEPLRKLNNNNKKTNSPIKKWAEDLDRRFCKDKQIANRHMKWCSALLIVREMQIKTTLRGITSHQSEWISLKNLQINAGKSGENGTLLCSWWNINWYIHYEKQYGGSLKNYK